MSSFRLIRATSGMVVLLAALGVSRNAVAGVIYSRPLPVINLNNAAGASRSNIAPLEGSFPPPFILGDDFMLSDAGLSGTYNINTLSVWEIGNLPLSGPTDPGGNAPSTEFSSITLFGGPDHTDLTAISSTYTATRVFYAGGLDYQSPNSGTYFPIYRLDFTNLNWIVNSNVLYNFAINAVPIGGNSFALSAANFGSSGVVGAGANNSFILYENDGTSWISTFNSDATSTPGFPKGSDANVSLDTSLVPEPSTISFIGVGLGAVLLGLRRRK